MISAEVVPAYFLPHTSSEFEWLGRVNPTVGKVDPEARCSAFKTTSWSIATVPA